MKTFNLDEHDVVCVLGGLYAYQAELMVESKSTDEMERETALGDLLQVDKLIALFKS